MKGQVNISKATIDRLPLYFRTLRLAQDEGIDIISSDELGRRLGITPEQIRKDLASFGQFGKKGVGYYVNELKRNVGEILGLNNHWNIAVIGIGHLGAALVSEALAGVFVLSDGLRVNCSKLVQGLGEHLDARFTDRLGRFKRFMDRVRQQCSGEDPISALRSMIMDIDYENWLRTNSSSDKAAEYRMANV